MRRHRMMTSLLVAAVLAVGCGNDDEDEGAGGTTVLPERTTSSAPSAADPALAARAEAAGLQAADFPPGWRTQPEDGGLGLDTTWPDLLRCLRVDVPAQGTASATSPTYVRDLATQAQSTVQYTTEAAAAAVAAALAGPGFQPCAEEVFSTAAQRTAPPGATPGPVEVAPLDVTTAGTRSFALRVTSTMNLPQMQVPLFQDFLVVLDDRAVIPMLFLNPGGPFPQDLQRSLVEKVVSRA